MKLTLLLSLLLSLCCLSALAQQPPAPAVVPIQPAAWVNAAPPGAGFTVLMPGKATEQTQPVGDNKAVENHLIMLETELAGYVVSYVQFPDEVTDPAAIKELLDRGRDGGVQSTNSQLQSEKEITLGGYLGREWLMTLPGDLTTKARAYWVKRRLYQVVFVIKAEPTDTPALKKLRDEAETKFLDSFILTGDTK